MAAGLFTLSLLLAATGASALAPICSACGCACYGPPGGPCGCWCIVSTGECDCFQCGPLALSAGGSDLELMDLPSGNVGACIPLEESIDRYSNSGTPVFFGINGTVRFLSDAELAASTFSRNVVEAPLTLTMRGLSTEAALRLVARAARIDLALPDGLRGQVDLQLKDIGWREAMNAVLETNRLDRSFALGTNAENGLVTVARAD